MTIVCLFVVSSYVGKSHAPFVFLYIYFYFSNRKLLSMFLRENRAFLRWETPKFLLEKMILQPWVTYMNLPVCTCQQISLWWTTMCLFKLFSRIHNNFSLFCFLVKPVEFSLFSVVSCWVRKYSYQKSKLYFGVVRLILL